MRQVLDLKAASREEWLLQRKKGIGGSDIGAIFSLSPFKSPLALWVDKTSPEIEPEDEDNIPMAVGRELEPFLAARFQRKFKKEYGLDIEVKEMDYMLQHDTVDYFLVTIDRWFKHPEWDNVGIELKTTSAYQKNAWEDEEIPESYYLQCQWALFITGWRLWYIGCLIGNSKFIIKPIPRNEEVIKVLEERAHDYWQNYVLKNVAPAPIGTERDDDIIDAMYPEADTGRHIEFNGDEQASIEKMIKEYDTLSKDIKASTLSLDTIKQKVKMLMGTAEWTRVSGRKIIYQNLVKHVPAYTSKYRLFRIF